MLLQGDVHLALAAWNTRVWQRRCEGEATGADCRGRRVFKPRGRAAGTARRPKAAERRALQLTRKSRFSAASRSLLANPPAPQTPKTRAKGEALFSLVWSVRATTESFEAAFSGELRAAAAFAARVDVSTAVTCTTIAEAVHSAPRGSALGPYGLRLGHTWALGDAGRAALKSVIALLKTKAAVEDIPTVVTRAHAGVNTAGANLLLLAKPRGLGADGPPRRRPRSLGMPEALHNLSTTVLSRTIPGAAAAFFQTIQLCVADPNACESILYMLEALSAADPSLMVLLMDVNNAFNLISRAAARDVLGRALPHISAFFERDYTGDPPSIYGWADPDEPPGTAASAPARCLLPGAPGAML